MVSPFPSLRYASSHLPQWGRIYDVSARRRPARRKPGFGQADIRLRRGVQTVRFAAETPGLIAVSRHIPEAAGETVIVYNTPTAPVTANIEVDAASADWSSPRGGWTSTATAPASVRVTVPALDYLICVSEGVR